ncbi:SMP-30/gluconolactonase/LRE family protein [Sphingopyxis indica]|uniref:Sugar lactone lactonase YvrE n=1 Tax=Sphingopyxis indica TaxID=436663 RepID=A0A239I767_9SPHN|nr:SMP-30/gluconolactonase/LRE family protein [Sphingopyxis indica]WOF42429.1 SMP-30/gluconolactonase/LRE family protein [Sphingopyxis indica]SNS89440.1 Sugar lactone lactonase YvrE [Sphingopyxis indica]
MSGRVEAEGPTRIAQPRHVYATGLQFGEGPRWHDDALFVSDMFGKRVVRIGADATVETIIEVPGAPSGLGWLPDGRMIVVSMTDSMLLSVAGGKMDAYADLSSICRGTPNDMVIDRHGRAYVGNAGCNLFKGVDPKPTNLVLVEDGKASEVADGLIFPNGMAINENGDTLIVAETFAHRLTAFSIRPDGSLGDRREFARLDGRTPDGICLDREGAVWVASAETGEVLRAREGGEIAVVVDVDGRFAAACVTGGADRRTLFLVLSETTPERFMRGESSCSIETIEISVAGAGIP